MENLRKKELVSLYTFKKLSSAQIAKQKRCSVSKVNYWLVHYGVPKRSVSDAAYAKHNPGGYPFLFKHPNTLQ